MQMKLTLFLLCVLLAASEVASAQAPPAPTTPPARTAPPAADRGCAPTQATPQGSITPKGTTTGQSQEPLGDKLARSDGILCPPAGVDPAMHAPTPESGSNTPVIPPPGSPGGDPTVRPK